MRQSIMTLLTILGKQKSKTSKGREKGGTKDQEGFG